MGTFFASYGDIRGNIIFLRGSSALFPRVFRRLCCRNAAAAPTLMSGPNHNHE